MVDWHNLGIPLPSGPEEADNYVRKSWPMDSLENQGEVKGILKGIGFTVKEKVIRDVVDVLRGQGSTSLYSLYKVGSPKYVCGKGTTSKIKHMYDDGRLNPYLAYLDRGQGEQTPGATDLVEPGVFEEGKPSTLSIRSSQAGSADLKGIVLRLLEKIWVPVAEEVTINNFEHGSGDHDEDMEGHRLFWTQAANEVVRCWVSGPEEYWFRTTILSLVVSPDDFAG